MSPDANVAKKRKSYRKKVKSKRFVDEVETPKLSLENRNVGSSSDEEPLAKLKARPKTTSGKPFTKDNAETAYETTIEEAAPVQSIPDTEGIADQSNCSCSDSHTDTTSESDAETSNEELVPDGKNGLRSRHSERQKSPVRAAVPDRNHLLTSGPYKETATPQILSPKRERLSNKQMTAPLSADANADQTAPEVTLPQRITQQVHNALVTDPSLHHISQRAKDKLVELLEDMETTYQLALKALPLRNATFQIAEVQTPFSDPKPDEILRKLNTLEERLDKLPPKQSPNSQNEPPPPTTTYANALKQPKSTLVVKTSKEDPKAVLTKLKKMNCPEEVRITKVKVLPGKLEVRCSTEEEKGTLHSFLQEHLPQEATVEEKRPQLTRIMALNVPKGIPERQLHRALALTEDQLSQLKTITTLRARRENAQHWILLCPKRLALSILEFGIINVGFNKIRIKRHVRLHRCKVCQHLNHHHTQECKSRVYCPKCAGDYTAA